MNGSKAIGERQTRGLTRYFWIGYRRGRRHPSRPYRAAGAHSVDRCRLRAAGMTVAPNTERQTWTWTSTQRDRATVAAEHELITFNRAQDPMLVGHQQMRDAGIIRKKITKKAWAVRA